MVNIAKAGTTVFVAPALIESFSNFMSYFIFSLERTVVASFLIVASGSSPETTLTSALPIKSVTATPSVPGYANQGPA